MNLLATAPPPIARRRAALFLAALLALPAVARAGGLATVDAEVRLLRPDAGRPIADPRPVFEIALPARRGEVLLTLDGVDVTGLSRRAGDRVLFEPAAPLSAGPHELAIAIADPEGITRQAWKVAVDAAGGPVRAFARGGLSASGQGTLASQGVRRDVTGSASLDLTAGVEAGAWEASVSGHAGWFPDGPAPKLTAGGFLWSLKRGEDSLVLGDVSASGTPLVAPSLSRRGLLLTLNHLDSTLQAYQLASRPVRGNDLGIRWSDWSDQLLGTNLRSALPGGLALQLSYVQGRQSSGASFATASIDGPSEGRAAGLALSGTVLGTSVALEGAYADHDADTRDGAPGVKDKAASARLGRSFGPVSLSGQYEWVGPDYASVADPGATRDRQQAGLSAATSLGPVSLSVTGGRGQDNVGGDRTRPVVVNTSGGATAGVALAGWPSLSLSWMKGLLGAERVPAGAPGLDTASDTASAALAWARGGYTASLSANRAWLDDRRGGADTTSTGLSLALSARPAPAFTVSPTWSRNVADAGGVTRTTDLAALSLAATLWPKVLTLAGQGSWARTGVSDGSAGSEQRSGVVRLGWELQHLARWLADLGSVVLGASGRYSQVQQAGTGGAAGTTTSSWGALLTLDVHAPFELGRGGGGGRGSDGGRAGSPASAAAPAVELTGTPPQRVTGTATGGPLAARRLALAFRDGRAEASTPRGGELRVRATLGFTGQGALQARWVVDGRPVEDVALALTSGDSLVLETGAPLPTFEPGRHVVTLELLLPAPPPGWRAPELTYVVTAEQAPSAPGGRP